jgi:hypothetical protein
VAKTAKADLEAFCVAHTLGNLEKTTQKVLGAVWAVKDIGDNTLECIAETSGVSSSLMEPALWDLECSGLIVAGTNEEGLTTYALTQLALGPVEDLVRKESWEGDYVKNLRSFVRQHFGQPSESPLLLSLVKIEPREIQAYTKDEKLDLIARIGRVTGKVSGQHAVRLKWLQAECHRHLGNIISSDDIYHEIADSVVPPDQGAVSATDRVRLLLEAATVAKTRVQTPVQLSRAARYLGPIESIDSARARALGMLTEIYAMLGDRLEYERYVKRVEAYKSEDPYEDLAALDLALVRARSAMERISMRF